MKLKLIMTSVKQKLNDFIKNFYFKISHIYIIFYLYIYYFYHYYYYDLETNFTILLLLFRWFERSLLLPSKLIMF